MLRVLLAIDQRLTREVVATALRNEPGVRVVSTVPDGAGGVTIAADLRPDVIVTCDGVQQPAEEVVAEFRAVCPDCKIVLLLMAAQSTDFPAGHVGADALVDASDGVDELIAAVRSVSR